MTDHNPAFPDRRRYLARVVLLAGTALRRVHRGRDRALWRTRPATT